jgi:N-acetylneuraminic acid mutarotase
MFAIPFVFRPRILLFAGIIALTPPSIRQMATAQAGVPNEWTWMGGSNTAAQPGVYGTLETPAAGNVPGSRRNAASWTDSSGNFWLFGGSGTDANGNSGYLNDLWEFSPSTNEWAWMSGSKTHNQPGVYGTLEEFAAGNIPGSRSSASSWIDGSGNLWLFGGSGNDANGIDSQLNDLWIFDPSTKEWAWMGGSSTVGNNSGTGRPGVYGTLKTPAAGNDPGGRYYASGWTDSSGNLWLFGGSAYDANGVKGYLNDLWEFNPSTYEWAWMGGSKTYTSLGMYGTLGTPAAGNTPSGRILTAGWSDNNGNYWLFGGQTYSDANGNNSCLNDLWAFNSSTNEWAWMGGSQTADQPGVYGALGTPAAANTPGCRNSSSSWADSDGNFWLFGGAGLDANGISGVLNDLWKYQPYPAAATPAFSLAQGTYTDLQTVTITDTTTNAIIYYTTDGTTPTASSTIYTAAIRVTATETLKAIAMASGYVSSLVNSAGYTINLPPLVGNLDLAVDIRTSSTTVQQTDSLFVTGWVADQTDGAPLGNVKVYIDGSLFGTPTLGLARPDVVVYFNNSAWANSGFQLVASAATLSIGTHSVTVVAIDSVARSTTLGPLTITVTGGPPIGNLDAAVDNATGSATLPQTDNLLVRGWVADPVDGSPLANVKVYVDGSLFGTPTLGLARSDVSSYFSKPAYASSGFELVASAASLSIGTHSVTVVAIDSGGRTFGPHTITVTGGPPVGNLDAAVDNATGSATLPQTDSLLVYGWVADPVDGSPLANVKVYIDGSLFGTPTLDLARSDVSSYFSKPAYVNSGFQLIASAATLSIGTHSVTVVAIDSGGRSTTFGPHTITVTGGPPVGNLETAVDSTTGSSTIPQADSLLVSGWVADPVDGSPLSNVKVYVDGTLFGTPTLDLARPDVSSYFSKPAYANSGFQLIASAATISIGTHSVTVVAIDSGGRSTTFGPHTITISSQ